MVDSLMQGASLGLLRGNAAGEFIVEGVVADEATAKALKQRLKAGSLSYWRSQGALNFTLHGVLPRQSGVVDGAWGKAEVEKRFGAWRAVAGQSGLATLTFEKPLAVDLGGTRRGLRQKLWGSGSLAVVGRFVAATAELPGVFLHEFVFDAAPNGGAGRLYAALDVLDGTTASAAKQEEN
jgi:hypothetical protein